MVMGCASRVGGPGGRQLKQKRSLCDGAFFVNDASYRKKEQQSLPRFKHIGRGLLSAGRAASCLDGVCATRNVALMARPTRGTRLYTWLVVNVLIVLQGVGHRLCADTPFTSSRRAC